MKANLNSNLERVKIAPKGRKIDKFEKTINIMVFVLAFLALLFGLFSPLQKWMPYLIIFLVFTFILVVPFVGSLLKYYSIGMWILGSFFLLEGKADLSVWQKAIGTNIYLVSLFVLVPLLSLPVKYGQYTKNINLFFRQLGGVKWKIHTFTNVLVGLLAPILTLGAVTMVKDLAPHFKNEKTFIVSLTRMFGITIMWTPYFGTVVVILSFLHMEWSEVVPFTLTFAIMGMILSIVIEKLKYRKEDKRGVGAGTKLEVDRRNVAELFIIILFILALTLAIYYMTPFTMTISVCLVAVTMPVFWFAYLRKLDKFKDGLKDYFANLLPKVKGEVLMMVSASFFGSAFVFSNYSHYIPEFFMLITGNHPVLFIALLSFIMIFIVAIGVHPFVMTTIFAATFGQGGIPISPTVLSVVVFASWGMALNLSPFSMTTLVVARDTDYSPYDVSVRLNIGFTIIFYLLLVCFASFLHFMGI